MSEVYVISLISTGGELAESIWTTQDLADLECARLNASNNSPYSHYSVCGPVELNKPGAHWEKAIE